MDLTTQTPESELDRIAKRKTQLDEDFFQLVPNVLVNHVAKGRILPIDMVVYMILKDYQGQNDKSWVSNQSVARLCGRDISSVKRSIHRLLKAGHIQRRETELGKTAFTFIKTTVIDGRAKCGTPPIPMPLPAPVSKELDEAGTSQTKDEGEVPNLLKDCADSGRTEASNCEAQPIVPPLQIEEEIYSAEELF